MKFALAAVIAAFLSQLPAIVHKAERQAARQADRQHARSGMKQDDPCSPATGSFYDVDCVP